MYKDEIELVEKMTIALCDRAKLKKYPKVTVTKSFRLAAVKWFRNQLLIGEYLLSQFQNGNFGEDDVKASIAHEIGHLMPSRLPWYHRIFKYIDFIIVYVACLVTFFFGSFWLISNTLFPFLIVLIVSLPFLPWLIRSIELPFELEADRNASKLIGSKALAKSIINKANRRRERGKGISETLVALESFLSHPSVNERIENLGYTLKIELA